MAVLGAIEIVLGIGFCIYAFILGGEPIPPSLLTAKPAETTLASLPTLTASPHSSLTFTVTMRVLKPTWTNTPVPPTYTPNYAPPITGTPVPTLIAHTWQSGPVVLFKDACCGDGGSPFEPPHPPSLIVYSDGQLFRLDGNGQILTVKLSQSELCALLNTVDQFGFFDYDPATYLSKEGLSKQLIMGAGTNFIKIDAWRSKDISLYNLSGYFSLQASDYAQCPDCRATGPTFLPSLWNTYLFLNRFKPTGLQPYQPTKTSVWVIDHRFGQSKDPRWPFASISLQQLYQDTRAGTDPYFFLGESAVFTRESATILADMFQIADPALFDHNGGLWFSDGKDSYLVVERPLLPYEAPIGKGQYKSIIPDPSISIPSTTLSCSPKDGVLQLPQP